MLANIKYVSPRAVSFISVSTLLKCFALQYKHAQKERVGENESSLMLLMSASAYVQKKSEIISAIGRGAGTGQLWTSLVDKRAIFYISHGAGSHGKVAM